MYYDGAIVLCCTVEDSTSTTESATNDGDEMMMPTYIKNISYFVFSRPYLKPLHRTKRLLLQNITCKINNPQCCKIAPCYVLMPRPAYRFSRVLYSTCCCLYTSYLLHMCDMINIDINIALCIIVH